MLGSSSPEIKIKVKVVELDSVARGIKNIETQLNGLARTLGISFTTLNGQLRQTTNFLTGFGNLLRVQTRLILGFTAIRTVGNAISSVTSSFIEFDRVLAEVRAITRASDGDMAVLAETLKKTAAMSTLTFSELGEAAKVLGQAGLSAQQVAKTLESVVKLSVATGSSVGDVAQLMTTALKVFRVQAEDSAKVANTFALAINKSKLTLDSLRIAFSYVAPIAAQTGESIESITANMMVLADKGLQASKIGTSLRQVYASLMKPSTRLLETFKKLGVTYDDVNLASHRLIDVIETLSKKGITLQDIFYSMGVRGATGFAYLIDSIDQIKAKEEILKEQGVLLEMYQTRLGAVEAKFKLLRNQIAVTAASLRNDLRPVLLQINQSLFIFVKGLVETIKALYKSGAAFTAVAGVIAMFIPGLNTVARAVVLLAGALGTAGVQLGLISNKIITVTDLVYALGAAFSALLPGPWKWIGMGISGILFLINKFSKDTQYISDDTKKRILSLTAVIEKLKTVSKPEDLTKNFFVALNTEVKKLEKEFPGIAEKLGSTMIQSLSNMFNKDMAKEWFEKYGKNVIEVEREMLRQTFAAIDELEEQKRKRMETVEKLKTYSTSEKETGAVKEYEEEIAKIDKELAVQNKIKDTLVKLIKTRDDYNKKVEKSAEFTQSLTSITENLIKLKKDTKVDMASLKTTEDYNKALAEQMNQLKLVTEKFIEEHKSVIEVSEDTGEIFIKGAKNIQEYQNAVSGTVNTIYRLITAEKRLLQTESDKIDKQYKSFTDKFNKLMEVSQQKAAPKEDQIKVFKKLVEEKRKAMVQAADIGNWKEVMNIANSIVDSTTRMARSNQEFAKSIGPHHLPRYLKQAKTYAKLATENLKSENLSKINELDNQIKEVFKSIGATIDKEVVAKVDGAAIKMKGLWGEVKDVWKEGIKVKVEHDEVDKYVKYLKNLKLTVPVKFEVTDKKTEKTTTGTTAAEETGQTGTTTEEKKKFGGLIKMLATGGLLPGYGGGDKVKAMLEPGEFVHRKEAVKLYGVDFMKAINNMAIPVETVKNIQHNINKNVTNTSNVQQTTINLHIDGKSKQASPRVRNILDELAQEINLAIARGEIV